PRETDRGARQDFRRGTGAHPGTLHLRPEADRRERPAHHDGVSERPQAVRGGGRTSTAGTGNRQRTPGGDRGNRGSGAETAANSGPGGLTAVRERYKVPSPGPKIASG